MIIYVEGVDGSGKTTLIQTLAKRLLSLNYDIELNAERYIPTRPGKGWRVPEEELYYMLYSMLVSNRIFFLDRGPISDIVYRVFDDYEPVTSYDKIRKWLKVHNNLMIIYCRTDDAKENMFKRGDDNPVSLKKHDEISKVYDIVMSNIPCYVYDYTADDKIDRLIVNIETIHRMGE